MAAEWNNTNLAEMVKMLGGLVTQSEVMPFVYVDSNGYSASQNYSRTGTELTGYSSNLNSSGSTRTVSKIATNVFSTSYLGIIELYTLADSWIDGDTIRPKYIITFTG
jgi:hypothetical protein